MAVVVFPVLDGFVVEEAGGLDFVVLRDDQLFELLFVIEPHEARSVFVFGKEQVEVVIDGGTGMLRSSDECIVVAYRWTHLQGGKADLYVISF